jgi:flagellar hook-associated protein 1 FlgK
MGIFDSLHIGYSGLSASQTGIDTTSHNISNANTEGYSKQNVTQKVQAPIHNLPGDVGAGVRIDSIARSHDEFVYSRLKSSESQVAYSEYMEKTLQEISTYTTDLDDLGTAKDIKDFFSSWSDVAQNPDDDSQKVVLLRSMESLTQNLNHTSKQLHNIQDRLNEEFKSGIDEVNRIASEIVELNKNINKVENTNSASANANDLRDQRDQLELELSKMLNVEVSKGRGETEYGAKINRTDQGVDYNVNVGGFNLIDGVSFHPLRADDSVNTTTLNSAYYMDHNQKKVDVTGSIRGGKLGAMLDLRGDRLDSNTNRATNSKIQGYIDNLDAFSKTFVEAVNSVYASSAQEKIVTDDLSEIGDSGRLSDLDGIKEGTFEIKVYDSFGKEVATRAINIDSSTTLHKNADGNINPNSIIEQINANKDDNSDNDGTNDLDDLFTADIVNGKLRIFPKSDSNYTIAIEDNGTNFGGRLGVNKLFKGDSADSITLTTEVKNNPSSIASFKAPIAGNSEVANQMVSLQYEKFTFEKSDGTKIEQGLEDFYRYSSSKVASDAHQATINKDAAEVLNKTVKDEFKSVSGVDMDEELVNLMMYQTAYQANAKIITTVDRMIDTLLGMKQ